MTRRTPGERPVVENDAFAAFAVRIIERMGTRAANDPDMLPALREIADLVEDQLHRAANGLHAQGYSWTEIAQRLGITRQSAHERFGRRIAG